MKLDGKAQSEEEASSANWKWLGFYFLKRHIEKVSYKDKKDILRHLQLDLMTIRKKAGEISPPIDPIRILPFRNINEIMETPIDGDGLLMPVNNGFIVKINSEIKGNHKRWVISHEIGHTYFFDSRYSPPRRVASYVFDSKDALKEEWFASRIARELLIPEDLLVGELIRHDVPSLESLDYLKSLFNVSLEVMLRRLFHDGSYWPAMIFTVDNSSRELGIPRIKNRYQDRRLNSISLRNLRMSLNDKRFVTLLKNAVECNGDAIAEKIDLPMNKEHSKPFIIEARINTYYPLSTLCLIRPLEL